MKSLGIMCNKSLIQRRLCLGHEGGYFFLSDLQYNALNYHTLLHIGFNWRLDVSKTVSQKSYFHLTIYLSPEERVDLSTFSPVCLPTEDYNPEGAVGHVYGRNLF